MLASTHLCTHMQRVCCRFRELVRRGRGTRQFDDNCKYEGAAPITNYPPPFLPPSPRKQPPLSLLDVNPSEWKSKSCPTCPTCLSASLSYALSDKLCQLFRYTSCMPARFPASHRVMFAPASILQCVNVWGGWVDIAACSVYAACTVYAAQVNSKTAS